MKVIKLPSPEEDTIKVRIAVSTLCTWTSKYVSVNERVFRGNSENFDQPEYDIGTVKELNNKPNNFDLKITNVDNQNQEYKLRISWLHYKGDTMAGELSSFETRGELATGESKDINETFIFES